MTDSIFTRTKQSLHPLTSLILSVLLTVVFSQTTSSITLFMEDARIAENVGPALQIGGVQSALLETAGH